MKQKKASVSVRPIAGEVLDPMRVKNLQKLVAHAVSMKTADVNVTNLADGSVHGSDGGVPSDLIYDQYLKTNLTFEQAKRADILRALADIPCFRVEVTSAGARAEAHAFYAALGYQELPKRFVKDL